MSESFISSKSVTLTDEQIRRYDADSRIELIAICERLTRERDEAREAYTDENLQKHGLIGKYGRLRAALAELIACKALRERIDGELSACHQEMSPQLQAMENEYQLRKPLAWRDARAALSGEPQPKRAYYETHEPPHCPTCGCGSAVGETTADCSTGVGGVTLAQMAENIKHGLDPYTESEASESRDYASARDALDRTVVELERYKKALYAANGFLIQLGREPVKLEYPKREGDNRDVSAERCRNAATVSGTPESYSCSDPSEDARTPAGAGIASPVVSGEPMRHAVECKCGKKFLTLEVGLHHVEHCQGERTPLKASAFSGTPSSGMGCVVCGKLFFQGRPTCNCNGPQLSQNGSENPKGE